MRSRTPRIGWLWLGLVLTVGLPGGVHAAAEVPLDLLDPRPREIQVRFEVSPREAPAQTRRVFSGAFTARVEPGKRESELRVVIPAAVVEAHLLRDHRPIAESFSDFVWTFDTETGHVISAEVSGRVRPELDWGFMKTSTQADIQIHMGTTITAGFERPKKVLGNLVFRYCTDAVAPSCRVVETTPYDPATGYVNAVGRVWVHSAIADVWNFSPLGEAVFHEHENVQDRLAQEPGAVELPAAAPIAPFPAVPAALPGASGAAALR